MESSKRSATKAISYRIVSSLITFLFSFILTHSFSLTIKIGISVELMKVLLYYLHERIWSNSKYGLIHQKGQTVWFTGFSGSGKSTIADAMQEKLSNKGYPVQILDGDKIRNTINKGLGFSAEDRDRNIFNIAHIAKLLNEAGVTVLVPVISPYAAPRKLAREIIGSFTGVYVDCPIEICEGRDPKGLYKKVRAGEIKHFTGISDPYEPPDDFDVTVNTHIESVDCCVYKILKIANL